MTFTTSAHDAVDGDTPVSCAPASGSPFALGSTTVDCSATDAAGNVRTGSFTVTVGDTSQPMLDLANDRIVEASGPGGAEVTYQVSATDAVDGSVPVTCVPPSGSVFPMGTTEVHCSATDSSSNTTDGEFSVTVRDTTAPALTLPGPITTSATSPAGAVVTYEATATDTVDGAVTESCTPASGSTFAIGTTTVTCVAVDAAGNESSGSFTVQVLDTVLVPRSANDCKKGGWTRLTDDRGVPFKNQGDCVSYVTTKGKNKAAG